MGVEKRKIIWSPNLAYAIGLITTDGSLSKDGRHIDFTSNDIELINNLKYCLKLENKIGKKLSGSTKKYSSFRIQFGDVLFYKWLLNIGLMPNKSKKLRSVKIPDKFFFDFLRGHLDGDGTIKRYNDPVYRNSLRLYISFVSASLSHILWIKQKITKLA